MCTGISGNVIRQQKLEAELNQPGLSMETPSGLILAKGRCTPMNGMPLHLCRHSAGVAPLLLGQQVYDGFVLWKQSQHRSLFGKLELSEIEGRSYRTPYQ